MTIGFVGAGKMAEAIMALLLDSEFCDVEHVYVSDISNARLDVLAAQYGVHITTQNRVVVDASDIVILAVKPQNLDVALEDLSASSAGKLFVSIAAGKPLVYFESKLPAARVIRVMPNLACQVGEGMSVYCGGSHASEEDLAIVGSIFERTGRVLRLDESLFDVVTALSGSGPAFFAYVLQALVEGAESGGMPRDSALILAEQTMLGTAKVLLERCVPPDAFISSVASKGGTTAAGLDVLRASPVANVLQTTIKAAADRSRELST